MNQSQPTESPAWLAGWTFTPEADKLFQETGSPLITRLGENPMTIDLQSTSLRVELSLPADQPAKCETGHAGLIIRIPGDGREQSAYFFRPDSKSLIIETEDRRFGFASDCEVRESEDGTLVTAVGELQQMVLAIDWDSFPIRMAVVSGYGYETELAAKARSLLFTSARAGAERSVAAAGHPARPGPETLFRSLLQPASVQAPFPWILTARGTPPANAPLSVLLSIAALSLDREVSAGFIGNLVESVSLPAGIAGAFDYPMLLQLVVHVHKLTGSWPRPPADDFEIYTRYLKQLPRSGTDRTRGNRSGALHAVLVAKEIDAWLYIHQRSGRPADADLEEVRQMAREQAGSTERNDKPGNDTWLSFAGLSPRARRNPARQHEALKSFASQLDATTDPLDRAAVWAAGIMLVDTADQPQGPWADGLTQCAVNEWHHYLDNTMAASRVIADEAACTAIAVGLWAEKKNREPAQEKAGPLRRAANAIARRPRIAASLAASLILLVAIWLVSIQFRTKYSEKALLTEVGMLQQLYKAGDYDQAKKRIDELERRGGMGKVPISFIRGKIFYRQQEFAGAAERFAYCHGEEPENPAFRYNLALSYLGMGEKSRALNLFIELARELELSNPVIATRAAMAAEIINSLGPGQSAQLGIGD